MESDQPIHNISPTKKDRLENSKTNSPEKSSGSSTRKSPQKQDFQAASQAVEQEYDAVKRLKRLSIGNSLNFDPDLPSNDAFFSETSSIGHNSLDAHLNRSKSKLSKHSYQEIHSDADDSGYNDYDDYENGYGKISFHDSIEIEQHESLLHNDEIEFDDENVDFLDLDPDSSFGDDNEIWVPATAHPKISPENFKKHIESRNQKLVNASLHRGSSLKHVTRDLSYETTESTSEQKDEMENRKPSLRELSAQLESLTKKAGLEDDDAITLARSLSKRSIGITKLEKEIYTRADDDNNLEDSLKQDSYPLSVRNNFLRNKANKSRESLFIKPDDEDDNNVEIDMDHNLESNVNKTSSYYRHGIVDPSNRLTRNKISNMKNNNLSSNHVYNDIKRVHDAQRPLSRKQLEPSRTLTPISKLPELPQTPSSSSSQRKQDVLSSTQRTLQNYPQQYQNHNQLQSPPNTPVKQGFNEVQQQQHQQRTPHRNSPRYQQEYQFSQQQSPSHPFHHQNQHQYQQSQNKQHFQQSIQRNQHPYIPQQNSSHHPRHQPLYQQQYTNQQQQPHAAADQRRVQRRQNQQLPPLQHVQQPPPPPPQQQQQSNFQQYQRQQFSQQTYPSNNKLHSQPRQQQNAPQALPKQRSPKGRLEKSDIDQSFSDERLEANVPFQSDMSSVTHSRNRYGSERNIVNLQTQQNTAQNRRAVSDNILHINKTSPPKEASVPILKLKTDDVEQVGIVPESPISELSQQTEQMQLNVKQVTDVPDQINEDKHQKEKKPKSSFTSFFKLKRDKPRSSSTTEEPKSVYKNKRSFSHSSESGSRSPKTDFISFFGGKKDKEKKEKKVEPSSEKIHTPKISSDLNTSSNERDSAKSLEQKNVAKASPKLGIGLFMLNKSSENLSDKKEKHEVKKGLAVNKTEKLDKEEGSDIINKTSDLDNNTEFTQKSTAVSFSNAAPTSPTNSPKKFTSEQSSPLSSDDQESESIVDRVEIPIVSNDDVKKADVKVEECESDSQEVPDQSNEIIKKSLRETLNQIERPTKPNQPLEMKDSAFGFPLPPVSNSTLIMLDHRFPVHVERAIYRLSHLKLADPKRALRQQVLLSNFMYSYLNLVNHTLWIQSKEQEESVLTGEVQQAITASELM